MTRSNRRKNQANGDNEEFQELKTPKRGGKTTRGSRGGRGRGHGSGSGAAGDSASHSAKSREPSPELFFEEDGEEILDENDLARAIQEEEKRGRLLDAKRRLADLKNENAKKFDELNSVRRDSSENCESDNHLPRLSESLGRKLPTLNEIQPATELDTS